MVVLDMRAIARRVDEDAGVLVDQGPAGALNGQAANRRIGRLDGHDVSNLAAVQRRAGLAVDRHSGPIDDKASLENAFRQMNRVARRRMGERLRDALPLAHRDDRRPRVRRRQNGCGDKRR